MKTKKTKTLQIKKKTKTEIDIPLAVGFDGSNTFLLSKQIIPEDNTYEIYITEGGKDNKFLGKKTKIKIIDKAKKAENISMCSDFKFSESGGKVVLTYTRLSEKGTILNYATTTATKKTWTIQHSLSKVKNPGVVIFGKNINTHIYFGDQILKIAKQSSLKTNKNTTFEIINPPRVPHWHFFEGIPFSVFGGMELDDYFIVFYSATHKVDIMKDINLSDQKIGEEKLLKIGFALFAKDQPTRLLWQSELPIIEVPIETHGEVHVLGIVPFDDSFRIYTASQNGEMGYLDIAKSFIIDNKNKKHTLLKKWSGNPILKPTHLDWERDGAFNPTALHLGGKIHLLYRAIGPDGMSRIGYASSKDGVNIDERLDYPIYTPQAWFEKNDSTEIDSKSHHLFSSGGGWGGCEDPKVTQIGDRVYLTYVAFTGSWPTRTVLTSISVDDFLKKKWRWTKPMLMSPPGVGSKSVALLPEMINNKHYIFHRVWPNIMIDIVDDLEFGDGKRYLEGHHMIRPRRSFWDSRKLSVGASPLKTKDGWLTIYNAVDRHDSSKYKIGAMLLDLDNPTNVIARSSKPILSPEEFYENDGKPGVAYPGGVVNLNDTLHVYYGGGDKVSAVAQINTDELINSLKRDIQPHLKITKLNKK